MTTQLHHAHSASVVQEKTKMPFDHEPFSASTPHSSLRRASAGDDRQSDTGQFALRPCIYIALRCSRCGPVRQAIAELPSLALIACPECGRECSFILLGSGLTSRNLPFHQVHIIDHMRWDPQVDGETNSS
jgi:hypothetical protein